MRIQKQRLSNLLATCVAFMAATLARAGSDSVPATAASNPPAATSTNPISPDALAGRYEPTSAAQIHQRWLLLGLMVALVLVGSVYYKRKKSKIVG